MPYSEKDVNAFLKAKRDCLVLADDSDSGHFFVDSNQQCPAEWDGYVCWKSTEPGFSATASCPKTSGSASIDKVLTRRCSENGHWEDVLNSCKADEESTTLFTTLNLNSEVDTSTSSKLITTEDFATTIAMATQTTASGLVGGDGNGNDNSTSAILTTPKPFEAQGGYIYDYYDQIDIIRALVNCVSVILLIVAIIFWCVVWCKSRYGHPYRCVSLLCIMVFSLLYHAVGVVTLLVYIPDGLGCQCVLTLKSYGDVGMYTFCFLYVILCIGIAMRRLESGGKFYLLITVAAILPLVLVSATTALRVLKHPDSNCDLLDELAYFLWFDRAPKTFLLFGTICILAVILYWLFCFDNTMFKWNRDFLLIRHSSVTLMILACYCFFLELYEILFLRNSVDGKIKTPAIARNGLILNILMSIKGAVAATLLCFFDIEIFNLIYAFPCCPDLGNAIVDQAWEKRIRSESKVKFFEDSSSDDNRSRSKSDASASSNKHPFARLQENQKPQAIQGYGTVVDNNGDQTP